MGSFTALPCGVCGEIGKHAYEREPRKGFTRRQLFSPLVAGYIEYKRKGDWEYQPKVWEGTGRMLVLRHLGQPVGELVAGYRIGALAAAVLGKHYPKGFITDPATAKTLDSL